jgi:hypothetical protein
LHGKARPPYWAMFWERAFLLWRFLLKGTPQVHCPWHLPRKLFLNFQNLQNKAPVFKTQALLLWRLFCSRNTLGCIRGKPRSSFKMTMRG